MLYASLCQPSYIMDWIRIDELKMLSARPLIV